METKALTARVPRSLAQKADEIAHRLDRSHDWIVKQALGAWIAQEDERHRLTMEALADVDSGQVIDHRAVREWIDSLDGDNPLPLPTP